MKILGEAATPWRQRRIYDPARGMVYEWTKTGTIDAIRAVEAALVPGSVYEVDETQPPMATITLRTPEVSDGNGDGILSISYELSRTISQKSGYEHPRALAISQDNLRTIRKALKDNTTSTSSLTGDAATFYGLMLKGQDSYVVNNFVFRITQTIQRNAQVAIAFSDTNRVYSSAAVISETGAGSTYQLAINSAYSSILAGQYQGSVPSGYTLGWLKQAPTLSTISGNRSAVMVEYWLEAWTGFYYP